MSNTGIITFYTKNGLVFPNKTGLFEKDRINQVVYQHFMFDQNTKLNVKLNDTVSLCTFFRFSVKEDQFYGTGFIGGTKDSYGRMGMFGAYILLKNAIPNNLSQIREFGYAIANNPSEPVDSVPQDFYNPNQNRYLITEDFNRKGYFLRKQIEDSEILFKTFFKTKKIGSYSQIYFHDGEFINEQQKELFSQKLDLLTGASLQLLTEIEESAYELRHWNDEKRRLKSIMQKIKGDYEELNNVSFGMRNENEELLRKMDSLNKEVTTLKSQYKEEKSLNETLTEENQRFKTKISDLNKKNSDYQREITEVNQLLTKHIEEIEELQEQNEKITRDKEKLKSEISVLNSRNLNSKNEISKLDHLLKRHINEIEELKKKNEKNDKITHENKKLKTLLDSKSHGGIVHHLYESNFSFNSSELDFINSLCVTISENSDHLTKELQELLYQRLFEMRNSDQIDSVLLEELLKSLTKANKSIKSERERSVAIIEKLASGFRKMFKLK